MADEQRDPVICRPLRSLIGSDGKIEGGVI